MIGEAPQPHADATQTVQPVQVLRRAEGLESGDLSLNFRLSRCERRVLAVISDPMQAEATVEQKAKQCGMTERRFYQIMRDPRFVRYWRGQVANVVQSRALRYIEAADQLAAKPTRDGFNDRRMLLEMAGHYVPRQQTDITSGGQPLVGVVGVALDEL